MNEWFTWNGGLCPVAGDALVDVILRDGSRHNAMQAVWWTGFGPTHDHWWHDGKRGDPRDIVQYRYSHAADNRRSEMA